LKDALRALLDKTSPYAPLLWCVSLAIVIALTLAPGLGPPATFGLDKIAHFAAYGGLAALAALTLQPRIRRWALLVLLIAACSTEVAQMLITDRSGKVADALANVLGIVVGTTVGRALTRLLNE